MNPVTAVVIAKDEERAIARCLQALRFCDQVVVIDSKSTDRTAAIAKNLGAEVVQFEWTGRYPKKKQWGMERKEVKNDWVLHLDADEIVSEPLAREIVDVLQLTGETGAAGFEVPLQYHFAGKKLRYGHRVRKVALVNKSKTAFPNVGDHGAPGITEVEGHYQPQVSGSVLRLRNHLIHDDPDPLYDWIARHNRYSDWEAHLQTEPEMRLNVRVNRSRSGRRFDRLPFKPLVFFCYSYVLRAGFLDGRAGFDYAFALAWYYWSISAKSRENNRNRH